MKAKEVLKLLNVTRATLTNYVKNGKLKVRELHNGYYEYDEEDVYKLSGIKEKRKTVIYCRVSTRSQKKDLENQKETLKTFCAKNGVTVDDIYEEIGSGISFDRKEFQRLFLDVLDYKVQTCYITYKDRLSRISFSLFKSLFSRFGCTLVILNEIDDSKILEKELFKEIIDLIHCFTMKVYSQRRKEKLALINKQLELEQKDIELEKC